MATKRKNSLKLWAGLCERIEHIESNGGSAYILDKSTLQQFKYDKLRHVLTNASIVEDLRGMMTVDYTRFELVSH